MSENDLISAQTGRRWVVLMLSTIVVIAVLALAVVTTVLITRNDASPPAATSTSTGHPVPVPVSPSPTTSPTFSDGGVFDSFMVREGFTSYASLSQLGDLATTICLSFDAGVPKEKIFDSLTVMRWGPTMTARFVGFAVASHCPRHSGKVQ